MKMTLRYDTETKESQMHFTGGLHNNEHSESVSEARDELLRAIETCQAAPHDPDYGPHPKDSNNSEDSEDSE